MNAQTVPDRLQYLLSGEAKPTWNGVDYVEVASSDQTQLLVHFLNVAPVKGTLSGQQPVTICSSETGGAVPVRPFDEATAWSTDDDGRPVLALAVSAPGGPSSYTLTVRSSVLDPYYDSATFSFDTTSTSALDCRPTGPDLAPAPVTDAPLVNYLAKDFSSFKTALSDFSSLRNPRWVERSEADFGVMVMEALSAIADELSYLQDRVAAEAYIATATQRVSLVRHARAVDYEPGPASAATVILQIDVAAGTDTIPSGLRFSASGADGQRIPFELGTSLADPDTGDPSPTLYAVDTRWNAGPPEARNLLPYWWDASQQYLAAGSTRVWVRGLGHGFAAGQQLLLDTPGPTSADPPVRELLVIGEITETTDPVFQVPLTRIDLEAPTQLEHDLSSTYLAGNLLPALQGTRSCETFAVPSDSTGLPAGEAPAVVRRGANWTPAEPRLDYRYTLAAEQVSWLPAGAFEYVPALAPPSVRQPQSIPSGGSLATGNYAYQVTAVTVNGETTAQAAQPIAVTGPNGSVTLSWDKVSASARYNVYGRVAGAMGRLATVGPFATDEEARFTDTGAAAPGAAPPSVNTTAGTTTVSQDSDLNADSASTPQVALVSGDAVWRWERWLLGSGSEDNVFTLVPERYSPVGASGATQWFDYDGEGTTVRFGDGTFGLNPRPGTEFTVTYIAGGGSIGNVPANTIVQVDPAPGQDSPIASVTNPFPATGGEDEETPQQIRDRAPQAFQSNPLRVVRTGDYATAARSLPWVNQAGTAFRWTGSWLTAFTTADPVLREDLTVAQLEELTDLLDRRRLAGYESYVLGPSYLSLDLEITVTADPSAFASDVQSAVLTSLRPGTLPSGARGFFDHDSWSFGQPLQSSALLAAIQQAHGVVGVTGVSYRQQGLGAGWSDLREVVQIPPDQILRVDDNPARPEDGSLTVIVEGGK